MIATTVMAVVILVWCGITLWLRGGPVNPVPMAPDLNPKVEYAEAVDQPDRVTGETIPSQWVRDDATKKLVPEKIKDEAARKSTSPG